MSTYADFGFDEITVKLSTRPEKRIGSDEDSDHAEQVMGKVLEQIKTEIQRQDHNRNQSGRGGLLRAQV